jgi:hypothetical protein
LINRHPEAAVLVVLDDLHICPVAQRLSSQPLPTVIDYDYREIPPGLGLERPDTADEVRIRCQCGDGDRYPDFRRHINMQDIGIE